MAVALEYELFLANLTAEPVSTPVPVEVQPPVVAVEVPLPNQSVLVWEEYLKARARAVSLGKPLVVRVGVKDDQLVDLLPECEHVYVGEFPETEWPAVVVGVGKEMWRYDLPRDATAMAVKAKLVGGTILPVPRAGPVRPAYQSSYAQPIPAYIQPARSFAGRSC